MIHVLPTDYEQCWLCGFDHEYESVEAQRAHQEIEACRSASPETGCQLAYQCDPDSCGKFSTDCRVKKEPYGYEGTGIELSNRSKIGLRMIQVERWGEIRAREMMAAMQEDAVPR